MLIKSLISDAQKFIGRGKLNMTLPNGSTTVCIGKKPGTTANIVLNDWNIFKRIQTHADIGFGEDYVLGYWDTDDLPKLLDLAMENTEYCHDMLAGHTFYRLLYALKQKFKTNSNEGSKRNIHHHYDLGNDFFKLWLDEGMTYSGALFNGDSSFTLEAAQTAKYQRILTKLDLKPKDRILEIGCGWGGFMEQAAKLDIPITGITISEEQARYARERFAGTELEKLITIVLKDYRLIKDQFDHIVSIGMFEHVGLEYWKDYMQTLKRCLKPAGSIMIQSIVIRDDLFDIYRSGSDFIREYIFPGGMLPTLPLLEQEAGKTGLMVKDVFYFGSDYALTLETWLQNFDRNREAISALGYDRAFIRKWRFYLAICAALFRAGRINVMQVKLESSIN